MGGAKQASSSERRVARIVRSGGRRAAHAVLRLLALGAALGSGSACALGLGPAALNSGLGEPLRMTLPVTLGADEDVGCVQVRAKGDELPSVFNTRSSVLRSGSRIRVEITSAQAVNEPAIGLVVSVGCTSPVSREYVLFLDPPAVPVAAALPDAAIAAPSPAISAPATRRSTGNAQRAAAPSGSAATRAQQDGAPALTTPRRPPRAGIPSGADGEGARTTPAPPFRATRDVPAATSAPTRDRLTIAPTGPQAGPTVSPATPPAAIAAAPTTAAPAAPVPTPTPTPAPAPAPGVVSPLVPAVTPASPPAVPAASTVQAVPGTSEAGEAAAREQTLRQQQAELQQQIKAMSEQIAALRVQTRALVDRNQVLQDTTSSPLLLWLLLALAVIALLVAGWMAWRYARLRRQIDGAAWWSGNTTGQMVVDSEHDSVAEKGGDLVPLDPGTRLVQRPVTHIDQKAAAPPPPAPATSNAGRVRPASSDVRYPAAIDTDFTVSDIEAAMATVRTVSPPREAPREQPLAESDFAPLGEPTLPAPYVEPPPAMPPPAVPPVPAQQQPPPQAPKPSPSAQVVERDGANVGHFVDLDIPPLSPLMPLPPAAPPPRTAATSPTAAKPEPTVSGVSTTQFFQRTAPIAPAEEEPEPPTLDFKLDIPNAFDPLSTDSMKTTVVQKADPGEAIDLELPASPSALDFELPSATRYAPLTASDAGTLDESSVRHGASALGDLFAPIGESGIDTILDLDDRQASPLTTTEVDRLTATSVEGPDGEVVHASTRARMARFADLMNQVDEVAATDPLRAIALLRQYVLRDERIPTLLWLRLFELYKVVDKKPVYEALAEHFMRRYDRPMVGWTQKLSDRVPQTPLSAMGEIDREIEAAWGKEEGLERLRALSCDRDQKDAIIFNAVLLRDLLDASKVFPPHAESLIGGDS